jgi:hypothetical protein
MAGFKAYKTGFDLRYTVKNGGEGGPEEFCTLKTATH